MKTKVTSKAIRESYKRVYQAPYASLQFIMNGEDARYYHSGTYGWNYDVYTNGLSVAITTGYRGTFGVKIPREMIEKFSTIAQGISRQPDTAWETKRQLLETNREAFYEALQTI